MHYLFAGFSTLTIFGALFFILGLTLSNYLRLPLIAAFLAPPLLFLVQYLLFPRLLDRFLSPVEWQPRDSPYPEINELLSNFRESQKKPIPRFGIIRSDFPEVYTYGHHKGNSRIIASAELLENLTPSERQFLIAHELHHIKTRDFLIPVCTGLVPLSLFLFAKSIILIGIGMKDLRSTRTIASFGALLWWVSRLMLMILYFFSRARERCADMSTLQDIDDPALYSSTLDKIERLQSQCIQRGSADLKRALSLSFLSNLDPWNACQSTFDPPDFTSSLQIGKREPGYNPWRSYSELFSSHPDPPGRRKLILGIKSPSKMDKEGRALTWEMLLYALPLITFGGGALASLLGWVSPGLPLVLFGISLYVSLRLRYPRFTSSKVDMRQSYLSALEGIPVSVKGIITKERTLSHHPHFLLLRFGKDSQAIPIEIFSHLPAEALIDDLHMSKEVEILGWFRRNPYSYIEVKEIRGEAAGTGKHPGKRMKLIHRSHYIALQYVIAFGCIMLGLLLITLQQKE